MDKPVGFPSISFPALLSRTPTRTKACRSTSDQTTMIFKIHGSIFIYFRLFPRLWARKALGRSAGGARAILATVRYSRGWRIGDGSGYPTHQ